MVQTDTIEGILNSSYRFHYDMTADVLYVRQLDAMDSPTIGDLNDDGDIVLRDEKSDRAVGITIISWWKRFGQGPLPDSISEIQKRIEPFANRVAA
jgi:Protein of unknown function (DUF2283)